LSGKSAIGDGQGKKTLLRNHRRGHGFVANQTKPNHWPQNSSGIKKTFNRALKNADTSVDNIQNIFAAGNGDKVLDAVEAEAYAEIFDASGNKPFITSIKGATGESFSSGGIRACALALSMEKNILPPTIGLTNPWRPLAFVTGEKKELKINSAALAGISFGGTYTYLIFGK
jgi:3-oxoacyl-[acyl-carrier-protein] synthase II